MTRCALHWWKPTARRTEGCACPRYVIGMDLAVGPDVTVGMLKVGEAGEERILVLRHPRLEQAVG